MKSKTDQVLELLGNVDYKVWKIDEFDDSIIGLSTTNQIVYCQEAMTEEYYEKNKERYDKLVEEDESYNPYESIDDFILYNFSSNNNPNSHQALIIINMIDASDYDEDELEDYILNEDSIVDYDAYDIGDYYNCIIGYTDGNIFYDYDKLINEIMDKYNINKEEALIKFKEIEDEVDEVEDEQRPFFVRMIEE